MPGGPPPGQQPVTPPPAPRVSIDQFAERRPRHTWLWAVAAVAVAVLIIGGFVLANGTPDTPADGPTPPAPSLFPSAPAADGARPWQLDDSKGTWRVVNTEWQAGQVTLEVEITCSQGELDYQMFHFPNQGSKGSRPVTAESTPDIQRGVVAAGDTRRGFVTFRVERGDGTLILMTRTNKAVSGLVFKG